MKKILHLALIFTFNIVFFSACADLDRDNILDPKNSSSSQQSVVVGELFVTTAVNSPANYNNFALAALDSLKKDFGQRFVPLVYHRNSASFSDPDVVPLVEPYYEAYTINYREEPGRFKGVPDLFINGPAERVQGASSVHTVIARSQPIINRQLLEKGAFVLETEITQKGQSIGGTIRIAPLGNKTSPPLLLQLLLTRNDGLTQKVLSIATPIEIGVIEQGQYLENDFSLNAISQAQNIYFLLRNEKNLAFVYAMGVGL